MTRVRFTSASIMVLLSTQLALAGAWPREQGSSFLSLQLSQNPDTLHASPNMTLFGEYGWTQSLTLGAKLEYDAALRQVDNHEFFARWHMPAGENGFQKALSLGVTGTFDDPNVRAAFSMGHGFSTRLGPAWADGELSATFPVDGGNTDFGAFGLIGLKPHDKIMTMVGVDVSSDGEGEVEKKLMPSVAWQIAEGKHLTVEYMFDLEAEAQDELAVGLWLEF